MNRVGQVTLLALMVATVIIFLAITLIDPMQEQLDATRTQMDCDNSSISDFDQAGCIVADLTIPNFVAFLLGLAGMFVVAKIFVG